MRVEKFFLFFGPKIASVKRGETEYGVAAIPAGGYVKISGMNPDDKLPEGEEHRGYYEMPVWKRIVVIGAGPAVNIVLAFAILFVVGLTSSVTADPDGRGGRSRRAPPAACSSRGDRLVAVDGSRFLDRRPRRAASKASASRSTPTAARAAPEGRLRGRDARPG